jgi:glycerol-3-phosphate acyltransferase PlsY
VLVEVGATVAGYLLGTLPVAQLVAARTGHDPTAEGSGNPGASNVYRTAGRRAGVLVAAGDVLKGAVATGLGLAAGGRLLGLVCGLAAVLGHVAPVTRRFRGGKGVATAAGVVAVLYPLLAGLGAVVWFAVVGATRLASLASLAVVVAVMVAVVITDVPAAEVLLLTALGVVIVVRHRANVARLLRGRERTLETSP